jgi:hypothetical protein
MKRLCSILMLTLFPFVPSVAAAAPSAAEPVTVLGVSRAGETTTLRLNVASGGCTRGGDFALVVVQEASRQTVRVVRLRADACELYAPHGATVSVSTKDVVAGKPLRIDNPLFVPRD